MTIEQFRTEYHLLDRVSDGTVETHHAQAAAGVMVMVHFVRGTESQNAEILDRIEHLETERRRKVLRTIEVDGVTTVVTRFILDLTTLENWLGLNSAPDDQSPPSTPPAERSMTSEASAATPPPGEFTRLFAMPPLRDDRAPAFPGPVADQGVGPAGTVTMSQYDTDSYRERLAAPPAGASPLPPSPAAPPPLVPTGPSEFTKVIESLPPPRVGPPPSSVAAPPPRPKPPPPRNRLLVLALLGVVLAAIVFVVIVAVLA